MPTQLTPDNSTYNRDLIGYGENPPRTKWPDRGRMAVQFVLNVEDGGENCILHGDEASEAFLAELAGIAPWAGKRHMSVESIYEYGSRVGIWRILDLFKEREIPLTLFTVGMAALRHPQIIERALKDTHEICSHGYRWWNYTDVPVEVEREHVSLAVEALASITGEKPKGWYTGRNSVHTRKLVDEAGHFLYNADRYNDDLPLWTYPLANSEPHLVIPYTLLN